MLASVFWSSETHLVLVRFLELHQVEETPTARYKEKSMGANMQPYFNPHVIRSSSESRS